MNNLKTKWLNKQVYLLAIFAISVTSCDEDTLHPYIGSWFYYISNTGNGKDMNFKEIRTYTENTFTDLLQYSVNNKWVDAIKLKGGLTVVDKTMNINITEVGISMLNEQTGMPTGEIYMYKKGSDDFKTIITESGLPTSYQLTYSISGRKMTLMTDSNGDGDFTDENESIIYTKQ